MFLEYQLDEFAAKTDDEKVLYTITTYQSTTHHLPPTPIWTYHLTPYKSYHVLSCHDMSFPSKSSHYLAPTYNNRQTINALRKSWGKMSEEGRAAALKLSLSPRAGKLVGQALSG